MNVIHEEVDSDSHMVIDPSLRFSKEKNDMAKEWSRNSNMAIIYDVTNVDDLERLIIKFKSMPEFRRAANS